MISLWLSLVEYSTNKMTINDLGLEMHDGFKQVNQGLDEHDAILREHPKILKEHPFYKK